MSFDINIRYKKVNGKDFINFVVISGNESDDAFLELIRQKLDNGAEFGFLMLSSDDKLITKGQYKLELKKVSE